MRQLPTTLWTILFTTAILLTSTVAAAAAEKALDSAAAHQLFSAPPRQYATAPLWVWNDQLTEQQIRGTLRDLAGQKVMQAFVHPRPGLMTPYLSDDWFRLWKIALDEAEKLGMNIWIYDENSYPSGFAGGHVSEVMPASRGRGLIFREMGQPPQLSDETIAVYELRDNALRNITARLGQGESFAKGKYIVAQARRATNSPWHGNRCYVDLMYPGVTETFLEVTLEAYKRNVGEHFGDRIPGAFTDEPNVRPAGGLPWTDHLPKAFQQRWGYDLLDHLPSLAQPVGDWKQVRHDYFQVVLDQFIQHWAQPYYAWCQANGLAFTGHYWDHEWPNCVGVTDNMAMSGWQQMPGIDCLMNQYREDTHAQFGNVRFVKEVQSVCNQLGRERFLCEIYGAGGWDLRFEDMKRIADWLGVLGVNFFDEHLSYITLRGARKADHPQSFSYHEPWWNSYHVMAQYLTRLSAAMSMGQQINHVLVIEPTTTVWMYQNDPTHASRRDEIGNAFFELLLHLERSQAEYDIGCEDIMARHGAAAISSDGTGTLRVGERTYNTVVLPPGIETVREETAKQLEAFVQSGGQLICCGPPPTLVNGRPSRRVQQLVKEASWQQVPADQVADRISPTLDRDGFALSRSTGDAGILFHQRRKLADGELLFLVNTSLHESSQGIVSTRAHSVHQWDLFQGQTTPYPFSRTDSSAAGNTASNNTASNNTVQCTFELPPCGSLLLLLSNEPGEPFSDATEQATRVSPTSPLQMQRTEPNVLTLDFVDISVGGETQKNVYFYRANELAWKKHGLPRNPWNSAVQYKNELITKTFAQNSGFEASYRFTIDGPVPPALHFVVERADLYSITCNGTSVKGTENSWWLDKAFHKIDITQTAREGENVVTISAQPFTMYHEIAAAYVLGDFSLRAASSGFVIVPPKPLSITKGLAHGTNLEGIAWLTAGIGVEQGSAAATNNDAKNNDANPEVIFDLGRPVDLSAIDIWNYNESGLSRRGVKSLRIVGTATLDGAKAWSSELGTFQLAQAPGGAPGATTGLAERIAVSGHGIRYVKFQILSNHGGVSYPAKSDAYDNAFVGLSEVRFHTGDAGASVQNIKNVRIHSVSSQLVRAGGFDRRATHLVDNSGLGKAAIGWSQQGMPFYASGVCYRRSYELENVAGRFIVAVPHWYGSVGKVLVNGQLCGHLVSQPWAVDVTAALRPGKNTVDVIVIGTLKNTLGPHHAGSVSGTAWPSMFQKGPASGPPSGSSYHTIGYGLFEPFTLLNSQ